MSDRAEQAQMVEDCEARESRLTDWERNFVDDIGKQLANGRDLTKKQADRLDEVWTKATERG